MSFSTVITGAGSGIGRALAHATGARGDEVTISDIDGESAERVAAEVRSRGGKAHAATVDVCDPDAVSALMHDARQRAGRLDYVFNNAGISVIGKAEDVPLSDWQQVLDIDVRGVVHGVTAAYPIMLEQGAGHIINISSLAGLIPAPNLTAYATAKHAVVGLSVSLRKEARTHGVRVSAACPGMVDTPISDNARLHNVSRDRIKALTARGVPVDECARAILRGVDRNQPIIVVGARARAMYHFYRLNPRLFTWVTDTGPGLLRRLKR